MPHDVKNFGALGDGTTLDTAAINRAIGVCHAAGGGTVVLSAGIYLSGTIELLSRVTLQLEAGAVLRGSGNLADYRPLPQSSEGRNTTLILARDATDVALTGCGTIDGNGDAFAFYDRADTYRDYAASCTRQQAEYDRVNDLPDDGPVQHRPRPGILILFLNCRNVQVSQLTLLNAPNWCLHVACSHGVLLTGLEIRSSQLLPNSGGIDVSLSHHVRISDCHIAAGDDAIAFSPCADGFGGGSCEHVTVSNCTLQSRSAALRIGWGEHPFRNLVFHNLVIHDSNRGICLCVRDRGGIENVLFANIVIQTRLYKGKWWGKGEPIHVSIVPASFSKAPMGRIRNVGFSHLVIEGEQGIVVVGEPANPVENLTFENVRLRLRTGPLQASFGGNYDLRPAADERRQVFAHAIAGLHADHVRNLAVRGLDLEGDEGLPDFFRDGIHVENFEEVTIDGFRDRVERSPGLGRGSSIRLERGRGASLRHASALGTSPLLVALAVEKIAREEKI
ncbi:MAG: hypothetical protein JWM32_3071 [Verrucomicrobia bacterium]|nr:hypothetical protein [Verrucomicrobiota bacterium]